MIRILWALFKHNNWNLTAFAGMALPSVLCSIMRKTYEILGDTKLVPQVPFAGVPPSWVTGKTPWLLKYTGEANPTLSFVEILFSQISNQVDSPSGSSKTIAWYSSHSTLRLVDSESFVWYRLR